MKLQIKVNPTTNIIEDAKFKTFGCGSAIASSSLATEWVKGKTVDEALGIKNTDIVKELSLPPVKIHCSVLAEDAIRAAIGDWKKKNSGAGTGTSRRPFPWHSGRKLSLTGRRDRVRRQDNHEHGQHRKSGYAAPARPPKASRSPTRRLPAFVRRWRRKTFRQPKADFAWVCRAVVVQA